MTNFAENTWIFERELKFAGIEVGARMTIIDLGSGKLFVHSPIGLTDKIKSEIRSLGKVAYVVAPNRMHHLFIKDFKSEFPDAKFYCAPSLEKKRSDFSFDGVISDDQTFPWNPVVKHKFVEGAPFYNEVVFFDSRTKTLVLTDLAAHICESKSLVTRMFLKTIGSFGHFGWTAIEKLLFIRNRRLFYKSIGEILTWDFDRVIMAHGVPVTTGAKASLQKSFAS